jgi:hypothetical protein
MRVTGREGIKQLTAVNSNIGFAEESVEFGTVFILVFCKESTK